jgi:hypothetical protein
MLDYMHGCVEMTEYLPRLDKNKNQQSLKNHIEGTQKLAGKA